MLYVMAMIASLLRALPGLKSFAASLLLASLAGGGSSCNLGSAAVNPVETPIPGNGGVVVDDGGTGGGTPVTDGNSGGRGTILAFGDSITEGTYGEPWGNKLARMTGRRVVISAKGNTTTASGLGRLSSAIDSARPSAVCILYGTVDARNGVSPSTIASNLARMTALARSKGVSVVVGTIPPQINGASKYNGVVTAANGAIPGAVGGAGGSVAGVYGAMSGKASLFHADGFHPVDAGQAVIAAAFADRL